MKITKILLYLNLFFLQSYLIRFQIGPYPSNIQEVLIATTVLAFFAEAVAEKSFIKRINGLGRNWIIVGFFTLTVISLFNTVLNQLDLIRHLKFLVFGSTLVLLFLHTFKPTEREKALDIAGLGAIAFGIFSLIFNLLGYNITHDLRLLGPLDAAVYLAYYTAPFFIFYTISLFETPSKSTLTKTILTALIIIATRSMGAIGASFIVAILYIFKKHSHTILRTKKAKITLALITIAVISSIFYTKILPTLQTEYSSLDERGEIWETSLFLLQDPDNSMLGLGLGQFQEYYFQSAKFVLQRQPLDLYVLQPHNIFLLFIFNFGIMGLFFLFYLMYLTTKKLIKSTEINIPTIALFILMYFFIHGLIDTPIFKNDLLPLFLLFLSLGLED